MGQDLVDVYDGFAETYDRHYSDPVCRAENAAVRLALQALGYPDKGVLDLGCGTGLYLDLFPDAAEGYTGVDLSPAMLDQAVAKHPDRTFLCMRAQDLNGGPERRGWEAVVSLFGSPSHIPLATFLKTCRHVTAPQPQLFLMWCAPARIQAIQEDPGHPLYGAPMEKHSLDRLEKMVAHHFPVARTLVTPFPSPDDRKYDIAIVEPG